MQRSDMETVIPDLTLGANANPTRRTTNGYAITLRLAAAYFVLYCVCTRMLADLIRVPGSRFPILGVRSPLRDIVMWVIRAVLHDTRPLELVGPGADKIYDWVLAAFLAVLALTIVGSWCVLDRRFQNRANVHRLLYLFVSMCLGASLIGYGTFKLIPNQMPAPSLNRFLEPYGQFSMPSVLWNSVGASRPYEMLLGAIEITNGILLFLRAFRVLASAMAVAVTAQVFVLNVAYDLPVKLYSFHLLLMAVWLAWQHRQRLLALVDVRRGTARDLWPSIFAVYLVCFGLWMSSKSWNSPYGGGVPRPPLYGIWNIDRMLIDGVERAPLISDYDRWRRIVVDSDNGLRIAFWRMDDTASIQLATINVQARTIDFGPAPNRGRFAFRQPDADHLFLDGVVDGHQLHLETQLDKTTFDMRDGHVHWVQERLNIQ